jgi:[FeFe] hydrogenase H-cluster maturation GTPase HydF
MMVVEDEDEDENEQLPNFRTSPSLPFDFRPLFWHPCPKGFSQPEHTMIIERDHIGIFGKMNAGKSSIMNLLTQQATSIVDPTPGTTSDTKVALQEIHGLGPVKLFDTAGFDEESELGRKKRDKVLDDLKACDLVLLVIDPATRTFEAEAAILDRAREQDKPLLVLYNLFTPAAADYVETVKTALPLLRFHHKHLLVAADPACRQPLLEFILTHYTPRRVQTELLPFAARDAFFVLNMPMDEQAPAGRLLRPQEMAHEYLVRHWAWPVSYRMDLERARGGDAGEQHRFEEFLKSLGRSPRAIITDSRAMDVMHRMTPPEIPLTTFSIMMINYTSQGRLEAFVRGAAALDHLQDGDRILIAEACNHSRIAEDIGTVQIPALIHRRWPGVVIEHNFGREFQDNRALQSYRLVIHCGGCMITPQKLQARIRDLDAIGVPYTNYGIFLSYAQGREALRRVLRPWGLDLTSRHRSG